MTQEPEAELTDDPPILFRLQADCNFYAYSIDDAMVKLCVHLLALVAGVEIKDTLLQPNSRMELQPAKDFPND